MMFANNSFFYPEADKKYLIIRTPELESYVGDINKNHFWRLVTSGPVSFVPQIGPWYKLFSFVEKRFYPLDLYKDCSWNGARIEEYIPNPDFGEVL